MCRNIEEHIIVCRENCLQTCFVFQHDNHMMHMFTLHVMFEIHVNLDFLQLFTLVNQEDVTVHYRGRARAAFWSVIC